MSADHDGVIRIHKAGVATVTATVKYHGTTTTGSFVVDVQ